MSSSMGSLASSSSRPGAAGPGAPPTPEVTVEQLARKGLSLVQAMRQSVRKTFNVPAHHRRGRNASGEDKQIVRDFKLRLHEVVTSYENLDKHSRIVPSRPGPSFSDNARNLLLEAGLDAESQNLYQDLVESINWNEHTQTYNFFNFTFLSNSAATPRRPLPRLGPSPQNISKNNLEGLISSLQRQYINSLGSFLQLHLAHYGTPSILMVDVWAPDGVTPPPKPMLLRVMQLAVTLRGATPELLVAKGNDENFTDPESDKIDLSLPSAHLVFRKISDHLTGVILSLQDAASPPQRQLDSLLRVVAMKYRLLFSQPCRLCGRVLRDGLPPVAMDRANLPLVHEACR